MNITVCRDCKNRKIGCHANCERYLKEKAQADALRRELRKQQEQDWEQKERISSSIKRMRRGKKH